MIDEETLRKLNEMKLHAMSDALQKLLADSPGNQLSFSEKVAMMRVSAQRDHRKRSMVIAENGAS